MGQTTDSVAITVTSTRLIISQNGISLVFGGQDIIRAEAVNAPSHPPVNTVSNAWFIRLYLTGPIREVYPTGYYDILLNAVSSPSSWNDKIDPRAGALIALAAITPMIRSAPSGGGGGGQVDTIVAGDAIDVDATDPVNPIVAVKVDGVTIGFNVSNELEVPAGGGGYVPTSRTIGTTAPLTGGGDLSANRTIAIPQANGSTSGYLASGDWTTFNNKQAAGNYLTDLTGDVTASGPGSAASTIANNAVTFAKMQAVSANILLGNDAAGTAVEEITCTAAGRALIDDATAADQRTTLGLGTAATVNTGTTAGTVPLTDNLNLFTAVSVPIVPNYNSLISPVVYSWINQPAALTIFMGQTRWFQAISLIGRKQARVHVYVSAGGSYVAGSKIRLLYRTQAAGYDATITNWLQLGASAHVETTFAIGISVFSSAWINLAALAMDDVLIAVAGLDGDGVADPSFLSISMDYR